MFILKNDMGGTYDSYFFFFLRDLTLISKETALFIIPETTKEQSFLSGPPLAFVIVVCVCAYVFVCVVCVCMWCVCMCVSVCVCVYVAETLKLGRPTAKWNSDRLHLQGTTALRTE